MDVLCIAAVLVEIKRICFHWDIADLLVQPLIIVEKDVEYATGRVFEQIRQGNPSGIVEVLGFIDDDCVEELIPGCCFLLTKPALLKWTSHHANRLTTVN